MRRLLLAPAAVLLILVLAPPILAEPPAAPSGSQRAGFEQRREQLLEHLRRRGVPLPSASVLPLPSGSAVTPPASASAGIVLDRAVLLARRWQELAESRHERRERSRAALVRQLGQRLSDPRVKDELKLHATRVAELSRLKFLAQNARSGPQRDQLLARIERLSALETRRHQRVLEQLRSTTAPSASSSALPAPPEHQVPR